MANPINNIRKRPRRVFTNSDGRLYIKLNNRRIYFKNQTDLKRLVQLLVKEFNKQKRKKVRRKQQRKQRATVKPKQKEMEIKYPMVAHSGASLAVAEQNEKLNKLERKIDSQLEAKVHELNKAKSQLLITDGRITQQEAQVQELPTIQQLKRYWDVEGREYSEEQAIAEYKKLLQHAKTQDAKITKLQESRNQLEQDKNQLESEIAAILQERERILHEREQFERDMNDNIRIMTDERDRLGDEITTARANHAGMLDELREQNRQTMLNYNKDVNTLIKQHEEKIMKSLDEHKNKTVRELQQREANAENARILKAWVNDDLQRSTLQSYITMQNRGIARQNGDINIENEDRKKKGLPEIPKIPDMMSLNKYEGGSYSKWDYITMNNLLSDANFRKFIKVDEELKDKLIKPENIQIPINQIAEIPKLDLPKLESIIDVMPPIETYQQPPTSPGEAAPEKPKKGIYRHRGKSGSQAHVEKYLQQKSEEKSINDKIKDLERQGFVDKDEDPGEMPPLERDPDVEDSDEDPEAIHHRIGEEMDNFMKQVKDNEKQMRERLGPRPPLEKGKQEGAGYKHEGLTDLEINEMMRKYKLFVGTFAADEMNKILPKKRFGFIINTEPRQKGDGHWVACYIDVMKDMSVDYYDSFGNDPNEIFLIGLKEIIDKLNPDVYLKFKINKIKEQRATSSNCGWHCMAFLINRFNGVPFKECTGYSDYAKGMKDVKQMKEKFKNFDFI